MLSCYPTSKVTKSANRTGRKKFSLHDAVSSENPGLLRQLLLASSKPNVYNRWGMMPLHIAAEIGDEELVKVLIERGADVNYSTQEVLGYSPPLLFAAANGRTGCVKLLLAARAFPDATDFWGNTALLKAACYNHIDCVRVLLQYGADPDEPNRWGATPLQYAALQGNHEVVGLLLNSGCDVSLQGEPKEPPSLVGAAIRGHYRSLELLTLAGVCVDQSYGEAGETALVHAIRHFQHACTGVPNFIEVAVDVSSSSTLADRLSCIYALLKHGASINVKCLDELHMFYHHGISSDALKEYHSLLLQLVIRAMSYERKLMRDPIKVLFQQIALLGPPSWDILQLLVSVGYTPDSDDLEVIQIHVDHSKLLKLDAFRRKPRSLQDLCRTTVRANCATNVFHSADKLPLPAMLKDFIMLKLPAMHSL